MDHVRGPFQTGPDAALKIYSSFGNSCVSRLLTGNLLAGKTEKALTEKRPGLDF